MTKLENGKRVPHLSFLWPLSLPLSLGENLLYSTNHDGCLVDVALSHWSETCSSAFLIMAMDLARIKILVVRNWSHIRLKGTLWCVVGVRQKKHTWRNVQMKSMARLLLILAAGIYLIFETLVKLEGTVIIVFCELMACMKVCAAI